MKESNANPKCVFLRKCVLLRDSRYYLRELGISWQTIFDALTVFPYLFLYKTICARNFFYNYMFWNYLVEDCIGCYSHKCC